MSGQVVGERIPLDYLIPPGNIDEHNPVLMKEVVTLARFAVKPTFPGSAQSRENSGPNPALPFHILEKDVKFSLKPFHDGMIAQFELSSPSIREYANRAEMSTNLVRNLEDSDPRIWCASTDYIVPGARTNFKVNCVSTGLGPENKSMVFFTGSAGLLALFLDEVLQTQTRTGLPINIRWLQYDNDRTRFMANLREEQRDRLKRRRVGNA